MEKIRVLHVFGALDSGGAESRTMDIYREIDKSKVQFDFLIHTNKKCFFEDEIIQMGGEIYRIPRFGVKTILSYKKEVEKFFKKHNEYKIIHGHMLSTAFIYQKIAKKYDIPIRIAHSRNGSPTKLNINSMIREVFKKLARFYVTEQLAVSKIAAKSAFGVRNIENEKVKIIPNAIKCDKYIFNEDIRSKVRKELNLENKLVIGHIGRFEEQKNHKFLIQIFNEIQKKNRDSVLLLIGGGKLEETIKIQVEKLGIVKKVIFAGVRSDVPDLLQAMDVLVFPSFFEGLPGVVLEAQAAGLPCIISDKITNEVKITNLVETISLNDDCIKWSQRVINKVYKSKRENTYEKIVKMGYDIKSIAKWYEEFYIKRIEEIS